MEIMNVNEGTQTHIDGKEAAGAERRLERRSDEEEADKDEEEEDRDEGSRTGRTVKLELDGMS